MDCLCLTKVRNQTTTKSWFNDLQPPLWVEADGNRPGAVTDLVPVSQSLCDWARDNAEKTLSRHCRVLKGISR